MTKPAIVVREQVTNKEIHRVEMSTPFTDSKLERVMMGLLRNMDTDKFYADDSECDEWLKKNAT